MVFDTHWNYEGAHDYTWYMQIPPPYEIHIDLCIHSSRYWNTVPLVRCHTDILLYSYFVLHERIHNTQRMLSMYTVPPDRYEGVILLFASPANPRPSAKCGWQVLMWYGDPLYLQWCCGRRDQEYCSYNVPPHFSRTGRWNLYTIFDLPAQQWNFEPAYSQIPCVASRVYIPAFRTYNRIQPHLFIHILMNGYWTVMEAFACQINGHASVSVHSIMLVVNLSDLRLYLRFLGIVIRLPVFPVVIVSIRANLQPTQQPVQPKIFLIFFNKPISL